MENLEMKEDIYLAHSIGLTGEKTDSIRVAERIRDVGFTVYASAENKSINDKSNHPTPVDIYRGDVDKLKRCRIMVVNLTGGLQDGTISEVGFVSGWNEHYYDHSSRVARDMYGDDAIYVLAYTSNERLLTPQFYENIASAGANHLVLGMVAVWGEFVGTEDNMIKRLEEIVKDGFIK